MSDADQLDDLTLTICPVHAALIRPGGVTCMAVMPAPNELTSGSDPESTGNIEQHKKET
jgi:hypothetical protein